MKKYECPDCGTEMAKTFEGFVCRKCACFCHQYALERITKLKQQIHKMRNCENCAIREYVIFGYCMLGREKEVECKNNDLQHWKQKK